MKVQQSLLGDLLILHDPLQASRELKERNIQSIPDKAISNELIDQPLLAKCNYLHFNEAEL